MVEPLDVVIPTVTKDYPTLGECVTSIFRYVADVRFVWLVSKERPPLADLAAAHAARVRWVDEATGPATLKEASRHVGTKRPGQSPRGVEKDYGRLGWLYQQCIKLEASKWCGEALSRRHLIVDSDIVFFRRVTMVEDGVALLSWQPEYKHGPYFEHLDKITGGRVRRVDERMSGVAHHMVFDEACLDGLRAVVRTATGSPLWRAFLEYAVVPEGGDIAAGSEYELYFNYALAEFPKTHRARALRMRDNSGVFDLDPSSYKLNVKDHHYRMVGARDAARDARDDRDWDLAAYHCRVLPLAHFALNATKDDALRRRIAADPRVCVHILKALKDAPSFRAAPAPDQAPLPERPVPAPKPATKAAPPPPASSAPKRAPKQGAAEAPVDALLGNPADMVSQIHGAWLAQKALRPTACVKGAWDGPPPRDGRLRRGLENLSTLVTAETCATLKVHGHCCVDGVLPPDLCRALKAELEAMRRRTSCGATATRNTPLFLELYRDRTLIRALAPLLPDLEKQEMRLQVNDGVRGAFDYHCDSSPGLDAREISALFYLNEAWAPAHGGELRLLPVPEPPAAFPPVAGRLVLFSAHAMLHATKPPSTAPRYCFTLWLYDDAAKRRAATKAQRGQKSALSALRSAAGKLKHAQHMADCLAEHHDDAAARAAALEGHWESVAKMRATADKVPQLKTAASPEAEGRIWPWW
ncbi:hypothetical protein SO694_00001173 [Aureococcus anophagefferens]|uniref:Fe2OG dioxygenase domain-containing protein n=1 Tax=Aureococcus anophagefferens TaxID=44056 RepID=A0ABR1GBF7_AURAN